MPNGSSTADSLRSIANSLSDVAGAYNELLKKDPPSNGGDVYARLQEETRLRSIANQLYFQASNLTLQDGDYSVQALQQSIDDAGAKLKELDDLKKGIEVMADVLVLGGAIMAKKAGPIISSLQELKSDLDNA